MPLLTLCHISLSLCLSFHPLLSDEPMLCSTYCALHQKIRRPRGNPNSPSPLMLCCATTPKKQLWPFCHVVDLHHHHRLHHHYHCCLQCSETQQSAPAEQRWCLRFDFQSLTVFNGLFGRMDKEKGSRDELCALDLY